MCAAGYFGALETMTLEDFLSQTPALLGGVPIRPEGPPDWPGADRAVAEALAAAVADGSWGKYGGWHGDALQEHLVALSGQKFALCCASGTHAIEVALRAVGVQPGDEVVLAGYDYPGNFLTVHAIGALPVLLDVEPDGWQMDSTQLREGLTEKTRAVIVSHLHGGLVDIETVVRVCREQGVAVIEDAAQQPGAMVQGMPAGGRGDFGVFSFGGSKLLSAGRGGALVTSQSTLHQRARLLLARGNNLLAPLSELQAVVLLPQMAALAERNGLRRQSVERLTRLLEGVPGLELLKNPLRGEPGYYKIGMKLDAEQFGLSRKVLSLAMRAEGMALDEGFRALPVGRSPQRYRAVGALPQTMKAHEGMMILHHPILLENSGAEQVAAALVRVHRHAAAFSRG